MCSIIHESKSEGQEVGPCQLTTACISVWSYLLRHDNAATVPQQQNAHANHNDGEINR